ncbi:cation:proton antiporter [uncultured Jatrophihabitans sp.]|uniref:cation:proton antiporter n=1 Tax=uncultured Jatrophihabitans sp. TaxID=1610747 RepID=UPI0035CABE09
MSTLSPVQQFLLDIAIILILARLLGTVARKLGQPPVIGEILAGVVLGPTLFSGNITSHLFLVENPVEGKPPVDLTGSWLTAIATLGLVLFMFIVGYEVDRSLFKGREQVAAAVSLGSIAVPMVGGTLLGLWLIDRHSDITTKHLPSALFVGAAMSVTAFPVLARILTDRGLHRTRIGGLAIASAAVDDIAAWSLLAVVVTIVGSEGTDDTWHILLAPAYLLVMAFVVRPLMRRVNERFLAIGRLTPDMLAIVVALLALSAFSTEWLNVHYIFGAFIMGACMPRETGAALREAILERLEQLSVLVLLPVFFVVSGVKVDLSSVGASGVGELLAILGVAIGGKFLGAYLGAKASGVGGRQAGALATLMNTRGLTELVILNVGLQLKVLDTKLFSLMVVMALVTTAMTGPMLRFIYPKRLIDRDIADADRAALAKGMDYRVLAILDPVPDAAADTALARAAVDLAAVRAPAQVVLVRLLPQQDPAKRLEVGTGLGAELMLMTRTMSELHTLAAAVGRAGVTVTAQAQFSDDIAADLTRYVVTAEPDLVVLTGSVELAPHELMPRILVHGVEPVAPTAVAVPATHDAGGDAALQIAAQLAVSRQLSLVLVGTGRRERGIAADLARRGIDASVGEVPEGALVVGPVAVPTTHFVARARPDDEINDINDWAGLVAAGVTAGRHA